MELQKQSFRHDAQDAHKGAIINRQDLSTPSAAYAGITESANGFSDLCRAFFDASQATKDIEFKNHHTKNHKEQAELERKRMLFLANSLINRLLTRLDERMEEFKLLANECNRTLDWKEDGFDTIMDQHDEEGEKKVLLQQSFEENQQQLEIIKAEAKKARMVAADTLENADDDPEALIKAEEARKTQDFLENKATRLEEGQEEIKQQIIESQQKMQALALAAENNLEERMAEQEKLNGLTTKMTQIEHFKSVVTAEGFNNQSSTEELKTLWRQSGEHAALQLQTAQKDTIAQEQETRDRPHSRSHRKHRNFTTETGEPDIQAMKEHNRLMRRSRRYKMQEQDNNQDGHTLKNESADSAPQRAEKGRSRTSAANNDGMGIKSATSLATPFQAAANGDTAQNITAPLADPALHKKPEPVIQIAALG